MAKSKKGKKRTNPLPGMNDLKTGLKHGIALGAGALLARAVANNLPLPDALSGGSKLTEAAIAAGVSVGAGFLAKKVKMLAPYADSIRDGGIALAFYKAAGPTILPVLAITQKAKNQAALDASAYNLLAMAKAQQAAADARSTTAGQPPAEVQGIGDAFVISKNGISTADRAPRDTAALAGVGEFYSAEKPGFSGTAPNRLRAPWQRSIYAKN